MSWKDKKCEDCDKYVSLRMPDLSARKGECRDRICAQKLYVFKPNMDPKAPPEPVELYTSSFYPVIDAQTNACAQFVSRIELPVLSAG